jgi:hypothetical protein
LRTDYTPGDIGFDPLGLKPSNPEGLKSMQTKELNSKYNNSCGPSKRSLYQVVTNPLSTSLDGRLAMLAAAGCMAQELASGKGILENLGIEFHL